MFLRLSLMALPFILAVTVREGIRAYVVNGLGDPTPRADNRLTLNPGAHFDPIMTGVIPLVLLFLGTPFLIGGAKPLNYNPSYFKDQKRGVVITSLTGPAANLLIAIAFALVIKIALLVGADGKGWIVQTSIYGIMINCFFMVFSLLPIPPFDGGRALMYILPYEQGRQLSTIEPYGFFIFIGIVVLIPEVIVRPTLFFASLIAQGLGIPVAF